MPRVFKPMEGVRVHELARFTTVAAAGAVLADRGADVIEIEHAERGDIRREPGRSADDLSNLEIAGAVT
jgi:crotonobetainyl-CoA:carnitine CoA-transferase CaiB-like acyl-CoA transferase